MKDTKDTENTDINDMSRTRKTSDSHVTCRLPSSTTVAKTDDRDGIACAYLSVFV